MTSPGIERIGNNVGFAANSLTNLEGGKGKEGEEDKDKNDNNKKKKKEEEGRKG